MNIILAIVILAGYTVGMIIKGKRVPASLSASVFDLKESQRWIWTVVLCAVVFLCVPTIIERTKEETQFLAFLAIGALGFVGAAPLVRDTTDIAYKVHCVAAGICAGCSQLMLVFNEPWLLLCWVPWVVAFVWIITKTHARWRTMVFWGEMVCFGNTFAYCLMG